MQGSGHSRDVGRGGYGDDEDPKLYRSIMTFLVTIYQHYSQSEDTIIPTLILCFRAHPVIILLACVYCVQIATTITGVLQADLNCVNYNEHLCTY